MAEDSTISLDDLPLELLAAIGASNACSSRASFNLKDVVRAATSTLERALIERALQVAEFNHTRAAAMLGISRRSLLYKLDKYDLDRTASAADLCK